MDRSEFAERLRRALGPSQPYRSEIRWTAWIAKAPEKVDRRSPAQDLGTYLLLNSVSPSWAMTAVGSEVSTVATPKGFFRANSRVRTAYFDRVASDPFDGALLLLAQQEMIPDNATADNWPAAIESCQLLRKDQNGTEVTYSFVLPTEDAAAAEQARVRGWERKEGEVVRSMTLDIAPTTPRLIE
ncbi:MAG: hypothetical protein SGJ09_15360 [Phycisphaerae bacterium]|nr:hypothetical protein [Phycisphaerae bacterium]